MNLLELDVALKFCENKISRMLAEQKYTVNKQTPDFKAKQKDREMWSKVKLDIDREIEKIILNNF